MLLIYNYVTFNVCCCTLIGPCIVYLRYWLLPPGRHFDVVREDRLKYKRSTQKFVLTWLFFNNYYSAIINCAYFHNPEMSILC